MTTVIVPVPTGQTRRIEKIARYGRKAIPIEELEIPGGRYLLMLVDERTGASFEVTLK